MFVDILGLGHPRTGTGYTSKLLKEWGLNVGHEQLGDDGIVCWQMIKKNRLEEPKGWTWSEMLENIYKRPEYKTLIYNVRDPKTSIPSIVFTEFIYSDTTKFIQNNLNINFGNNRVENAIKSIIKFDEVIMEMKPDIVYRIEYDKTHLYEQLSNMGYEIKMIQYEKKYNSRKHKSLDDLKEELDNVDHNLKKQLNDFCDRLGYDKLFVM